MVWSEYLKLVAPEAQQREIARAAGVDQATVSRWRRAGVPPRPENVATFARAFGRPVLEAFVAAGFLSSAEAKERPRGRPRLDLVTNEELLSELARRLASANQQGSAPLEPARADLDLAAHRGDLVIGHEELPHEA